ncbi:hypothetical protein DL771_002505 [Monosporascus sp. 5C6A]|nr:hypothetical protein DL771_002505 [Monosporascus sp. 5C6A]
MTTVLFIGLELSKYFAGVSSAPAWRPPLDNLTALNTEFAPSWVVEPGGRGTWSLLYSCVFTLALCVYSAIHLNVPPPGDRFHYYRRKTVWVLIAIFAPEVVLFTAWSQWLSATTLCRKLNEGRAPDDPDRVDLTFGYFVVQGGLAVDVSEFSNFETLTLAPSGVLLLASRGYVLDIRREAIDDKSKANLLAKGLICFQVTWMVVQAIARKAFGYPIALLELHTLVHVFCALLMYGLWMNKSMDVQEPTVVTPQSLKGTGNAREVLPNLVALMLSQSRVSKDEFAIAASDSSPREEAFNMTEGGETAEIPKRSTTLAMQPLEGKKAARDRAATQAGAQEVFEDPLRKRMPNLDFGHVDDWLSDDSKVTVLLAALLLVCAGYGGIHLAAWNFEFPYPPSSCFGVSVVSRPW